MEHLNFQKMWDAQVDGSEVRHPKIDHNKVVWIYHDYGYGANDYAGEEESSTILYLANLLPTGPGPASKLLKTTESDPNQLVGANISGDTIVWSYYNNDTYLTNLYSADLEMICGDWGYLPADLNKDCKVNLIDFAKFAESWLLCTDPNKAGCIVGILNN